MKRLWPWLLTIAVYGGLLSAIGMMIGEWIATSHGLGAAALLLLYAAATPTMYVVVMAFAIEHLGRRAGKHDRSRLRFGR